MTKFLTIIIWYSLKKDMFIQYSSLFLTTTLKHPLSWNTENVHNGSKLKNGEI
jgi:hypothetical protein